MGLATVCRNGKFVQEYHNDPQNDCHICGGQYQIVKDTSDRRYKICPRCGAQPNGVKFQYEK